MDWNSIWTSVMNWVTSTGIKIIVALIIMWIVFKVINAIARKIEKKNLASGKMDKTLARMIISAVTLLKVMVVLALVGWLGIDTSGFAALVASLGVCIGLAVNGALGNIAGGVLLMVTHPFHVDDYVEIAGQAGTVEAINLVSTKLVTIDNRVVYIPNGTASTGNIINYTEKNLRRVDHTFAIAYGADYAKAKEILLAVCAVLLTVLLCMKLQIRKMREELSRNLDPAYNRQITVTLLDRSLSRLAAADLPGLVRDGQLLGRLLRPSGGLQDRARGGRHRDASPAARRPHQAGLKSFFGNNFKLQSAKPAAATAGCAISKPDFWPATAGNATMTAS